MIKIKALLARMAEKLVTLASDISTAQSDIGSLQTTVGGHTTDIGNLKTKVGTATLNTSASNLSGAVNELLSDINGTIATYSPNSSITNSRGQLRVCKQGDMVYVIGGIGNATSTVGTSTNLFAAMAAAYRPSSNVTIQGWVNEAMANFTVRSDGYIRQTLSSNMNNCFFAGFYKV